MRVQVRVPVLRGVGQLGAPRLWLLGTLTLGHVVVHWYQQLFALILPSVKADLGLSDVQVGTLSTARQAVSSGLNLPSGYVADSYPKYVALILALALASFGLGYFLIGIAPSYAWVVPAVAVTGVGTALWHPAAIGSLSVRFPERRGMALSIHGSGASVGDAIAPLAVGALITVFAWQQVMQFHLLPALVVALVLWVSLRRLYRQEGPKPSFRSYLGGIRSMLTNRQVLAVLASNSLTGMGRLSVMTFFPIYISETLGYSSFILGVYLTLLYVLGFVSQPVMGIVSDRYGRKAVMVPSFAAMGLLFIALVFAAGGVQLGLVVGALGLFFYAVANVTSSAVMDVASEGVQSSTFGVMGLFSQPFTLASPILAGYLVTEFGIKSAFWYAAATTLVGCAVLIPVRFRRVPAAGHSAQ